MTSRTHDFYGCSCYGAIGVVRFFDNLPLLCNAIIKQMNGQQTNATRIANE